MKTFVAVEDTNFRCGDLVLQEVEVEVEAGESLLSRLWEGDKDNGRETTISNTLTGCALILLIAGSGKIAKLSSSFLCIYSVLSLTFILAVV